MSRAADDPWFLANVSHSPVFAVASEAVKLLSWPDRRRLTLYGKEVTVPRQELWFGDREYHYSGAVIVPEMMPDWMVALGRLMTAVCGEEFNSCLANRYVDGLDSVSWHSDDEAIFGEDPVIVSVSFGATRRFLLKEVATGLLSDVPLANGDVLVMRAGCQRSHKHSIPKQPSVKRERVSLTFRKVLR